MGGRGNSTERARRSRLEDSNAARFSDSEKSVFDRDYLDLSTGDLLAEFLKTNDPDFDKLPTNVKAAIRKYTEDSHDINFPLREGKKPSGDYKAIEKALSRSFKYSIDKDVIVTRGVHITESSDIYKVFTSKGSTYREKSYLSHSAGGAFSGNVIFRTRIPKGTRATYVDKISAFKGEKELLLRKNAVFRNTNVSQSGGTVYVDRVFLGYGKARNK